jgi:hypothetical protein
VPHTRQITAEQSPQISGSLTSRAQLGQYSASGEDDLGLSVSGISLKHNPRSNQHAAAATGNWQLAQLKADAASAGRQTSIGRL